ncbi:MAG: preprotein translocase subunit SecG [Oscillospiraceae bacterium]|jgi:preprotein translocase subunit SecG|nr:preprotein translocase subunit SecG [Oscillospiraceae bacterium]MBQ5897174.1 preprotein translocase subunit SecG [Oscillospiraceae bacterium]
MTVFEIIGSILLIITCVLVTVTVLFQSSSKADGISALTGGKSASASAAEAKSNNAKLARITKVLAIVFFVVTLAVYALTIYL